MTVHQLPAETGVFARYLKGLAALIDPGSGWYGIFWQRDPEGMRACLDGTEIPPWDVVESLLQDLAAERGTQFAKLESVRARQLHSASAAAHDRRPGGREALEERLELMLREEVYATGRADELLRGLAGEPEGSAAAEQLAHELEWTRDDYARATARVSELRSRHAELCGDARQVGGPEHSREADDWEGRHEGVPAARTAHETPQAEDDGWNGFRERQVSSYETDGAAGRSPAYGANGPAYEPDRATSGPSAYETNGAVSGAPAYVANGPAAGSAAGASAGVAYQTNGPAAGPQPGASAGPAYEAAAPAPVTQPGPPALPDDWFRPQPAATHDGPSAQADPTPPEARPPADRPAGKKKRRPRGARFAGVEGSGDEVAAVPVLPVVGEVPRGARFGGAAGEQQTPTALEAPAGARQSARETVAALGRLRAEGRSGEAHAVLCEAAARPAPWLPVLAAELNRAGLAADWITLLWEAASQPALRLAAAAGALAAAGRGEDSRQLLRQGVTRPADDIAAAVLALEDEGREPEARALLTAFVQLHSAEDTVRIADRDPRRLVPQLLDAARTISAAHERDLVHALRVAGHLGA
ncbi:hypothetical protein [Streptomyces sp. NPDC005408]|uniref:hypothetical protein n=1 Tax=Streptomyces sp. NPDC005408 TaxID=3155341 RepID=UPI0033A2A019